jgi:hypothetical protein
MGHFCFRHRNNAQVPQIQEETVRDLHGMHVKNLLCGEPTEFLLTIAQSRIRIISDGLGLVSCLLMADRPHGNLSADKTTQIGLKNMGLRPVGA